MLEPVVIVRARAGEELAVELVARHALGVALRVSAAIMGSREQAEDIAQETVVLALRSLSRLRDPSRFDAWVARTATMASLQALRKPHRRRESLERDPALAGAGEPSDAAFDRVAATPELRDALSRLSARQRSALALRYVLDMDDPQIAASLGCRVGTVRALLSRGRAQLQADSSLSAHRGLPAPVPAIPPPVRSRRR